MKKPPDLLTSCFVSTIRTYNRSPICPVLVDPTLVICPNVGAVTLVLGLFNCRQLNTLNDSNRNWICEAAAQGERLRKRQVHAPTARPAHIGGVLVARPNRCTRGRRGRHQRVRASIEVLQRIAPVVEYLVAAVVIGPAVRNARRLGNP